MPVGFATHSADYSSQSGRYRIYTCAQRARTGRRHRFPQTTMLTDLTEPLETIFGRFSSSCKNRIHKAERDGLTFCLYDSADLKSDPSLLASFKKIFPNLPH
jgi:hypothetical protein